MVQSRDVTVREIPFHAYLTNRRVILQSPHDQRIRDKELALDRVEGLESLANDAGEPVLAISAKTPSVESRRLFITFAGKPSGRLRTDERDAWHRYLFSILNVPATATSRTPVERAARNDEDRRVRYDPGKLVFSPGICDAGDPSPKKKEVRLEIRGVPKSDQGCHFPPGIPGPSPEILRQSPPVSRPPDRTRQLPSSHPGAPRTVRPMASSGDGSFFCTTCGGRVRAGSRYCDRCGAKVIPPDPVLPASPSDLPPSPANTSSLPGMAGDSYPQVKDTGLHLQTGERGRGGYGAVPPVRSETGTDDVDARRNLPSPEPMRKKSVFPAFRKSSSSESRDTASLPVPRERGRRSHRSRIAISLVAAIMVICVIVGVVALVSPGDFSRALSGIVPVGVSVNGTVTPTPAVAGNAVQGSPMVKSGETRVQNAVSSVSPVGISLKIQYSGPWSGSYDMVDSKQAVEGTGEKIFTVENVEDSVTANIKKEDTSSNNLVVELYRNGEMIATGHTTEPGGQVTVSGSI
ncbi:hypothetical protein [Methanoregula sp.]|uniref:hypothetical protein n=1 Tax=Methanoregula sp. TaxID=2052170 RepID=UPI00237235E5|nr:hypothetical protein [Methanoregula sp.]MDD1687854.1 hypothetical protein [Methanoregula sp.]